MRFNPLNPLAGDREPAPPVETVRPKKPRKTIPKGLDLAPFESMPDAHVKLLLAEPAMPTEDVRRARIEFADFCKSGGYRNWREAWSAFMGYRVQGPGSRQQDPRPKTQNPIAPIPLPAPP